MFRKYIVRSIFGGYYTDQVTRSKRAARNEFDRIACGISGRVHPDGERVELWECRRGTESPDLLLRAIGNRATW